MPQPVDQTARLASPDPAERAQAAGNPDLTAEQVAAWCAAEHDPDVLAAWAAHPNVHLAAPMLRATGHPAIVAALDANPAAGDRAGNVRPLRHTPPPTEGTAPDLPAAPQNPPATQHANMLESQPTVAAGPATLAQAVPELSAEALLPPRPAMPATGWRRGVWRATGGLIKPAPSKAEQHRQLLHTHSNAPLPAGRAVRIAVVSTKGGIGKTTTCAMLGHTLAAHRQDRIIAVDANPDMGTLGLRVADHSAATIRDLLEAERPASHRDIRAFTQLADTRLEVLASPPDPHISEAIGATDYREALDRIQPYYSVILTDTGTGVLHDAMGEILATCDQLVLVAGTAVDEAASAGAAMGWFDRHGHADLLSNAVVAINGARPRTRIDIGRITGHFAARCRHVVTIPWDKTLFLGGTDTPEHLNPATRDAYLELAAAVATGWSARRASP